MSQSDRLFMFIFSRSRTFIPSQLLLILSDIIILTSAQLVVRGTNPPSHGTSSGVGRPPPSLPPCLPALATPGSPFCFLAAPARLGPDTAGGGGGGGGEPQ